MPSFLDRFVTNKVVEAPVEVEFPSTGFIGQVSATMLYQFQTMLDLQGPEFRDEVPMPYGREQRPDGTYVYYYQDQAAANQAAKVDESAFAPQMVWYFSMPVSSVLNVDTSKFTSQNITRSCRVTTLRSKYRHEFHMIALPAIVRACAVALGYDVPEVDFGPLAVNGAIIPESLSYELIGDKQNYTESKLWKQREALWAALGEPDARKYLIDVKDKHGNLHRDCTTAKKLIECLRLYHYQWSGPIWGRLVMIADPRPEAIAKSGNRLTLPALMEIYEDKAGAEAAKEADLMKQAGVKVAVTGSSPDEDMPPAPAGWENNLGDWMEVVAGFMTMAKPVAKKSYDAEEYGVPFEELWTWVEYLKKA